MKKSTKTNVKARREFLRASAIAGAGATIAASMPASAVAVADDAQAPRPSENYRVTKHVADYYKTLG